MQRYRVFLKAGHNFVNLTYRLSRMVWRFVKSMDNNCIGYQYFSFVSP